MHLGRNSLNIYWGKNCSEQKFQRPMKYILYVCTLFPCMIFEIIKQIGAKASEMLRLLLSFPTFNFPRTVIILVPEDVKVNLTFFSFLRL
jgi:hypothetical protein